MAKVITFDTFVDAEKNVKEYSHKNKLVWEGMRDLGSAREKVYRNSSEYKKLHGKKKDAAITEEEALKVLEGIGKGEAFTSILRLYKPIYKLGIENLNLYAFDEHYLALDCQVSYYDPCESIPSVVETIQEHLEHKNKSSLGAKVIPFFFTVKEPFVLSEDHKHLFKELVGYENWGLSGQKIIDRGLERYIERGFTDTEMEEFIRKYARFFN